ncbi:MAG: hypothetical protein KDC38_19510 [Planctomycetes bacterium]|nr:hypothetical protein [Planctomycetota bacterium]
MSPHRSRELDQSSRSSLRPASALWSPVLLALWLGGIGVGLPGPTEARRAVVDLGPGRHLFLGDALIDTLGGAMRKWHQPVRDPSPIIRGRGTPDQCSQPYVSVLRDEATGSFLLWYNSRDGDAPETRISLAVSSDGRHWTEPSRVVMTFHGYGCSIIEVPPSLRRGGDRFRLAYWANFEAARYNESKRIGVSTAISPDGVTWADDPTNPIIPDRWEWSPENDPEHVGDPRFKRSPGDIVDLVYDAPRRRFLIANKSWTQPPTEFGPVSRSYPYGRRLVSRTSSRDFRTWSPLERIFVPDARDEGETEFYGCKVVVRGRQLIGFLRVLRDDVDDGVGYTVLAYSDDGEHWMRRREPFLDRSPEPDRWDSAVSWVGECLTVGDREYIYFGAYSGGHKKFDDRTLGFATLRRDGFVSLESESESEARLRTPPLRLDGRRLLLNAEIRGELHARWLDREGRPLPGFGEADASPVRGDSVGHELKWSRPLHALPPDGAILDLRWRDGSVYALELL